jgi:hypothetical protein
MRDGFQVLRIDATSYATEVVKLQAFGYRTHEHLVDETVGWSGAEATVAIFVMAPGPQPATADTHVNSS